MKVMGKQEPDLLVRIISCSAVNVGESYACPVAPTVGVLYNQFVFTFSSVCSKGAKLYYNSRTPVGLLMCRRAFSG